MPGPIPLPRSLHRSRTGRPAPLLLAAALANAGAVIAYLPLLGLLLPLKVERLAGGGRIDLLSATVVIGGIVASVANIAFGWASDRRVMRGGGRRVPILWGLVLLVASYATMAAATGAVGIVVAVIVVQVAVNAVVAPFFALLADEVPGTQKGLVGGLMSLASPFASALATALVAMPLLGETVRLMVLPLVSAACFLPLLAIRAAADPGEHDAPSPAPCAPRPARIDLVVASAARLLIQVASVVLGAYLLYYFESVAGGMPPLELAARVGTLLTIAYIVPMPFAILFGRLSDRIGRRKPFLLAAAALAAAGIATMALAHDWTTGAAGFGVYALGATVFLSLHTGFALQLLPDPRHRGRDLGLFNLSNTLPSLVGPWLTWWLAAPHDFAALLWVVAALTACGGVAMLAVRSRV